MRKCCCGACSGMSSATISGSRTILKVEGGVDERRDPLNTGMLARMPAP
ncbi:hypothetical protein GCM10022380_15230 [Amycolatopsis tucumanensis]|uniref:Uncharacterized protein n=1 Tax=Amycolatopsis tucumanensis TaxID=401106 RepID=A0ABP7HQ19_9PSEU